MKDTCILSNVTRLFEEKKVTKVDLWPFQAPKNYYSLQISSNFKKNYFSSKNQNYVEKMKEYLKIFYLLGGKGGEWEGVHWLLDKHVCVEAALVLG